jgi:hypothetical protein
VKTTVPGISSRSSIRVVTLSPPNLASQVYDRRRLVAGSLSRWPIDWELPIKAYQKPKSHRLGGP